MGVGGGGGRQEREGAEGKRKERERSVTIKGEKWRRKIRKIGMICWRERERDGGGETLYCLSKHCKKYMGFAGVGSTAGGNVYRREKGGGGRRETI